MKSITKKRKIDRFRKYDSTKKVLNTTNIKSSQTNSFKNITLYTLLSNNNLKIQIIITTNISFFKNFFKNIENNKAITTTSTKDILIFKK